MLGIPVFIEHASYENHPLGRTEWIKVYGVLLDKEEEAEAFFNSQASVIDEFAEIENKLKQRETMREGFEKLRALAEKHKLKLSFGFGMRPGMRGAEAQRPSDRSQMRRNDVAKINAVRERYPAEWKKVLELRQQNKHGEARALTRELIQRLETPGKTAPQQPAGK